MVSCIAHQEFKLRDLFEQRIREEARAEARDVWEVKVPSQNGEPLISGRVFVRGTEKAVKDFMDMNYCSGHLIFDSLHHAPLVIPDDEMDFFLKLYEQYANELVILEKPFEHFYSHTDKQTGREVLNLCAKVLDGPFAGRIGYIVKIKRNKCLAFKLGEDMCISISNAWNYRLERIPDASQDYMSTSSRLLRDADYLVSMLQQAGFTTNWTQPAQQIISSLKEKLSFSSLSQRLKLMAGQERQEEAYRNLAQAMKQLPLEGLNAITRLVNYSLTTHGEIPYLQTYHLRPFLTPLIDAPQETLTISPSLTEHQLIVSIPEERYYKENNETRTEKHQYVAHVYTQQCTEGVCLHANWDEFFAPYENLDVGARLVQDYQVKTNCPQLYEALHSNDKSHLFRNHLVLAEKDNTYKFNTLSIKTDTLDADTMQEFIHQNILLCQAINKTTHLSLWRNRLHTVWLQK